MDKKNCGLFHEETEPSFFCYAWRQYYTQVGRDPDLARPCMECRFWGEENEDWKEEFAHIIENGIREDPTPERSSFYAAIAEVVEQVRREQEHGQRRR